MFSISAIIMSMNVGSTEATNLAAIKWKHAVNSWQLLNESLHSKCTNMDFFVCYVNDLHQFTVKIDNFTVELIECFSCDQHILSMVFSCYQIVTGDAQMIEADVMIGAHLRNTTTVPNIPIMSHPPKNESDLSLQEFLTKMLSHNSKNNITKGVKGVKLDFKTIEVFNESLPLLKNIWRKVSKQSNFHLIGVRQIQAQFTIDIIYIC